MSWQGPYGKINVKTPLLLHINNSCLNQIIYGVLQSSIKLLFIYNATFLNATLKIEIFQCLPGIIRCTCPKGAGKSNTADYRVERIEILDSRGNSRKHGLLKMARHRVKKIKFAVTSLCRTPSTLLAIHKRPIYLHDRFLCLSLT